MPPDLRGSTKGALRKVSKRREERNIGASEGIIFLPSLDILARSHVGAGLIEGSISGSDI